MANIEARQTGAGMFCALAGPASMLLAALPPKWVVLATAVAAIWWSIPMEKGANRWPKGVLTSLARLGALLLSLGVLAIGVQLGGAAYPTAKDGWILGALLLAVSIWAAGQGQKVLLRTGAILFWFLVIIYAAIGAFSVSSMTPRSLSAMPRGNLWPLALLWLPMACFWTERPAHPTVLWRGSWAAIAVGPCLLCCLTLGPALTAVDSFALYTLTKSISILDILERFEVLLSAAVTAGVFCLNGWMAHICLHQWKILTSDRWKVSAPIVLFLAACGLSRLPLPWLGWGICLLGAIFWGAVPLAAQFVGYAKKSKKIEKKC